MEERIAIDRTRRLIGKRLGVSLATTRGEAYREAEGLNGDWIGAFAQPGVILNAATAVRVSLADTGGHAVDEYGESTLDIVARDGDRVELRKRYKGKGRIGEFCYVGRFGDGAIAGYWYSAHRPQFCGVFWMARSDRLDDATRTALDARVRSHSIRREVLYAVLLVILWGAIAGVLGYPRLALISVFAVLLGRYLLLERTDAMRREMELWKRELG